MATTIADAIPSIVSARLKRYLALKTVYAARTNRNFQAELADSGDRFVVNVVDPSTVTEAAYVDQTADSATTITYTPVGIGTAVTVQVDQQRYWSFQMTDIQEAQVKPDLMDQASAIAADKLVNVVENKVRADFWAGASKKFADIAVDFNTPANLNAGTKVHAAFQRAAAYFHEMKIPEAGRWAIIGPLTAMYFSKVLDNDDIRNAASENQDAFRRGFMGMVSGIQTFVSPINLSSGVEQIIFGNDYGYLFVDQVDKVETLRLEGSFGTGVRGLYTYGGKMLEDTGFLRAQVTYSNALALTNV